MKYKLFLTTTECSARCAHCRFSGNIETDMSNSALTRLQLELDRNDKCVYLLSGGEPTDSDNLIPVVELLESKGVFFRIATAGFNDLSAYEFIWRMKFFTGVSVSTDVIRAERDEKNINHVSVWKKNIEYLKTNHISYSVTITLLKQECLDEASLNILRLVNPDFFHIIVDSNSRLSSGHLELRKFLTDTFRDCCVTYSELELL